jgi:BlaI family penicillinase repressor
MPNPAPTPQPTEAELAILEVLWESGPSTVRQVHDVLNGRREAPSGYTTVLKLMQIMARKGLVERDESERSHIYMATDGRDETRRGIVGALIEKAFAGSTSQLVLSALSTQRASQPELDAIRAYLDSQTDENGGPDA